MSKSFQMTDPIDESYVIWRIIYEKGHGYKKESLVACRKHIEAMLKAKIDHFCVEITKKGACIVTFGQYPESIFRVDVVNNVITVTQIGVDNA